MTPTVTDVLDLLDRAENLSNDAVEATAYNYLIDAVRDDLWSPNDSHESLRLWCLCHDILVRACDKSRKKVEDDTS